MVKLNSLVGKTIAKVEKSQKLDHGFIITFSDGSTLECCWNNWEGFYNYELKQNEMNEASGNDTAKDVEIDY